MIHYLRQKYEMHIKSYVHSIYNDYLPVSSCLLLAVIKQKNQIRLPHFLN